MKGIKKLLGHLIGSDNILSNNILFIDFTGSHEKGQFLSQLYYWSSRTKRKDGFFAKTYDEWYSEIRIKKHSLRRYAKEFKEQGFLEIEFWKFNGVPTLHYRLNTDKLNEALITFCEGNNLSGGNTELPRGLQIVTLEGSTESPSIEGSTESPSINRDYQRLHIETTTEIRKSEIEKEKIKTSKQDKPQTSTNSPEIDLEKFPWQRATDFLMERFKNHRVTRMHIKSIKEETGWKGTVKSFREMVEDLFRYMEDNSTKYGHLIYSLPSNDDSYHRWISKVMARLKDFMKRRAKDQQQNTSKSKVPVGFLNATS